MANYKDLTDEALIVEYKQTNNGEIVGELFKRYKLIVFGICRKYLSDSSSAQDCAMEIFEDLFSSLKTAEIRLFKPWICTVTRNFLRRKYRVDSKERFDSLDDLMQNNSKNFMENTSEMTLVSEKDEIEEKEQNLVKAINSLKKDQANCINLFYLKQKSYAEVCQETGLNFKMVKSYIQNGKRNLRKILTEGKKL